MLKGQVGAAGKDWASSFTDASTAADDNVRSCRGSRVTGQHLARALAPQPNPVPLKQSAIVPSTSAPAASPERLRSGSESTAKTCAGRAASVGACSAGDEAVVNG